MSAPLVRVGVPKTTDEFVYKYTGHTNTIACMQVVDNGEEVREANAFTRCAHAVILARNLLGVSNLRFLCVFSIIRFFRVKYIVMVDLFELIRSSGGGI